MKLNPLSPALPQRRPMLAHHALSHLLQGTATLASGFYPRASAFPRVWGLSGGQCKLLLDQFPRHIHRGTPQAFAGDARALELTLDGLQKGADAALDPVLRIFFCMPLQHSELREAQEESVLAFRRLAGEAPAELRPVFEGTVEFAQRHQQIIERFGRFPHRNAVLGRASTPEELDWLAGGGERFGQ